LKPASALLPTRPDRYERYWKEWHRRAKEVAKSS
jgi:hypothetical protein